MRMIRAILLTTLILATLLSPAFRPSTISNAQTPLPSSALIVDDGDMGFALFGPSTGWRTATSTTNDYYNGHMTWTSNISNTSTNENYAHWSLPVSATLPMTYEVRAFMPRYNSTSQTARYIIVHGNLTDTTTINQNNFYAEWVSLGSYGFVTGTNYVELGDATGEVSGPKRIGFDAIAFVPQIPLVPSTPTVTPTLTLPFTPKGRVTLPLVERGGMTAIGTPSTTTSRYIQTLDPTRHYRMGCEAGMRGERGIVILSFGQPWLLDDNFSEGVLIFGALIPATMTQVSDATKAFVRGYAECVVGDTSHAIQLGLGVNNYKGETNASHGKVWAQMVNSVDDWLRMSPYANRVSIFGAVDVESAFNTSANTRAWFDGYMANAKRPLINFGSCDGCPTALDPAHQPSNGWTVDDLWYVNRSTNSVRSMPEIYLRSGITADQWYHISLYSVMQHGKKIEYAGALTQYAACKEKEPVNCALNGTDNTPDMGMRQLNNAINVDARTAFSVTAVSDITWRQDVTVTTQARKITLLRVAHATLRSGYVIEDVQPPLSALAFIGRNVWVGETSVGAVHIYAGLIRDWKGKDEADGRGGLAIFALQDDGTVALTQIEPAPMAVGSLHVISAEGDVVIIASDEATVEFRFDVKTGQWQR